jgi:hypothetical protein
MFIVSTLTRTVGAESGADDVADDDGAGPATNAPVTASADPITCKAVRRPGIETSLAGGRP